MSYLNRGLACSQSQFLVEDLLHDGLGEMPAPSRGSSGEPCAIPWKEMAARPVAMNAL